MHADCTSTQLAFEGLGRRAVVGRFDGGRLTTDGGVLLLREVDRRFRVTSRLAACFRDQPPLLPLSKTHSADSSLTERAVAGRFPIVLFKRLRPLDQAVATQPFGTSSLKHK